MSFFSRHQFCLLLASFSLGDVWRTVAGRWRGGRTVGEARAAASPHRCVSLRPRRLCPTGSSEAVSPCPVLPGVPDDPHPHRALHFHRGPDLRRGPGMRGERAGRGPRAPQWGARAKGERGPGCPGSQGGLPPVGEHGPLITYGAGGRARVAPWSQSSITAGTGELAGL